MALTPSNMLALNTQAPEFALPNPLSGQTVKLSDFSGQPVVIAFICNHCPFVLHTQDAFVKLAREYQAKGVAVVAISSNDVNDYPEDAPEKMAELARQNNYSFPYLYDADQSVAHAYDAACTPDLYLFDAQHRLYYRGQFDASRPSNQEPVDGADLRQALDQLLAGQAAPEIQTPSMGCNIKWKE